jgi:hypothetical protein
MKELHAINKLLSQRYPQATMISICRHFEGESATLMFYADAWHQEESPREELGFIATVVAYGTLLARFHSRSLDEMRGMIEAASANLATTRQPQA